MSGIRAGGERRLVLLSGRAHPQLSSDIGDELESGLVPVTAYDFANGEIYIRFAESVRGADAFIVQSHTQPINKWIMEHLLMVDAAKRASAKTITVVLPFFGYARQDKKHRGREPISARLMTDLFKTAGADRLICVDLHSAQLQGFFDGPVDHLWAMPILTEYVRSRVDTSNVTVVSPDAGRIRVAEQWAAKLGGAPLAFIHKTRDITQPNKAKANRVVGDVDGRTCVLVDDLIDTGGTIAEAVRVLLEAGAKDVVVAATHGVLSDPAAERLAGCGAREVIVTDTLPIPDEHRFPQLTILSIAPLIARAIREVFDDGSVTSLFDEGGAVMRGISVTGTGQVRIVPDIALVTLGARAEASTQQRAVEQATASLMAMRQALLDAGVPEANLQTSRTNTWGSRSKHTASMSLTARIEPVAAADDLIAAALAAGGERGLVESVRFSSTDTSGSQVRARELAMTAAGEKAAHLAGLAARSLGPVRSIVENTYVNEMASDYAMPAGGQMRAMAAPKLAVDAGTQEVRVDLTVVYDWD